MRFTAYTRSKKIATNYMYFCIEKIVWKPCKRVLLFMQIFLFVKGPPVISNSTLSSLAAEYCIAKTSRFACNLHFAKIKHANDNLSKNFVFPWFFFTYFQRGFFNTIALGCHEIKIQLLLFWELLQRDLQASIGKPWVVH